MVYDGGRPKVPPPFPKPSPAKGGTATDLETRFRRLTGLPATTPSLQANASYFDDFDNEIDGLSSGWFPNSFTTFPSAEELKNLQSSLGR